MGGLSIGLDITKAEQHLCVVPLFVCCFASQVLFLYLYYSVRHSFHRDDVAVFSYDVHIPHMSAFACMDEACLAVYHAFSGRHGHMAGAYLGAAHGVVGVVVGEMERAYSCNGFCKRDGGSSVQDAEILARGW